jgi:hypothetical protein
VYNKKSVGIFVDLENTNILGYLLSHFDKLRNHLKDKPATFADLCNALKYFKGPVTKSAITLHPNHWQCNPTAFFHTYAPTTASSSSSLLSSLSPSKEVKDTSCNAADQAEDKIRA